MPKLEVEKQENGSLTGVKAAGEGSQGITAEQAAEIEAIEASERRLASISRAWSSVRRGVAA